MKFILLSLAMLVTCSAMATDANQMHYVQLVPPKDTISVTGSSVDVSAYKGNAILLAEFETSTEAGYTGVVTFATSATGSTWNTITNIEGTAAVITKIGGFTNSTPDSISVDSGRLSKYIRASVSQPGAETNAVSAIAVFPMKSN